MKLATYLKDDEPRVGAVVGDQLYDLFAALQASGQGEPKWATSVLGLLAAGEAGLASAQTALTWAQLHDTTLAQPLATTKLLAPIPCPGKLLCLAGNYASHIQEGGGTYIGKEKMIPRVLRLSVPMTRYAFPPPWPGRIGS